MGPNIAAVEVQQKYVIKVVLEDGRIAYIDMAPYLEKEMYKDLKDINIFNNFEIFYDTIKWPNGADIAPEIILKGAK